MNTKSKFKQIVKDNDKFFKKGPKDCSNSMLKAQLEIKYLISLIYTYKISNIKEDYSE